MMSSLIIFDVETAFHLEPSFGRRLSGSMTFHSDATPSEEDAACWDRKKQLPIVEDIITKILINKKLRAFDHNYHLIRIWMDNESGERIYNNDCDC